MGILTQAGLGADDFESSITSPSLSRSNFEKVIPRRRELFLLEFRENLRVLSPAMPGRIIGFEIGLA
jgi:hypothetical protein